MSSTACQGLLVEPPRALFLKLAPAKDSGHASDSSSSSSWLRNCFFQSPSDKSSSADKNAPEYVHPLTKRRLSMLSDKSLEMCTESLGNETGTHVGEYYVSPAAVRGKEAKPVTNNLSRSVQNFPPPLKSTGLQVMSRREGGRLVVEAVTAEEWRSVFRVERSEGRIRVEMVRDSEETSVEAAEVDDSVSGGGEDMEGNTGIVEGELGTEKFGRQIRSCMESQRRSNKGGLLKRQNWDSFLVTI